MVLWCFAAGGSGRLQKVDGMIKGGHYEEILQQHHLVNAWA